MILVVILLCLWLVYDYDKTKKKPKLIKAYHEKGLSDKDITIFRQTMHEAKNQIEVWEKAVKDDQELQVIESITGGLASSKKMFQFIVKEPSNALSNNDFLYKDLPTMVELLDTYSNLKAIDKCDQELLIESQKVIKQLSEKVANKYALTLSANIEKVKSEVENG